MSSLLTDAQKTQLAADLDSVFDTFSEVIVLHFDSKVATITTSANYSRYYQKTSGGQIKTPQHETVNACVLYLSQQEVDILNADGMGSQIKIPVQAGAIRIRMKQSEATRLTDVKKFEFDNKRFEPIGPRKRHGLFSRNRVDIICNPTED